MRIWELDGEKNVYSEDISTTNNLLFLAETIDGYISERTPENPHDPPLIESAKDRFSSIIPNCVMGIGG